ncbi:MAG TPA: hypothetical protein VIH42_04050 [Thermoguttaceae bacterium]
MYLHQYDERDVYQAEVSPIYRIVYSCCEDDFHKIYVFDENEQEYVGEIIREAA